MFMCQIETLQLYLQTAYCEQLDLNSKIRLKLQTGILIVQSFIYVPCRGSFCFWIGRQPVAIPFQLSWLI